MIDLAAREFPHGTRARYNSTKCRCIACRCANAAYEQQRQRDPRIDAEPARAHLSALSARGVGLRAVSDATDIPRVALKRIMLGQPKIRRSLATKILAADETVIADHALVPAAEMQQLLRELIREGYTKSRLAMQLGHKVPALQYKGDRVLAKTEQRVRKLHAALLAESADDVPPVDESPRARILMALSWFESVGAEDLFDAMGIEDGDRDRFMQALHRMAIAGVVERLGKKPFQYRRPS